MSISKQLSGVLVQALDGSKIELSSIWKEKPAVAIWLRHYGCIFCREEAAEVNKIKPLLDKKGVDLVCIGNGPVRYAQGFLDETKFVGKLYTDPELSSYKALDWKKETMLGALFSFSMWKKAWSAYRKGFRQTQTQGEAGQLGGVLIAHGDKVLYKHKEQYAGDHAPLNEILKSIGYDEETANKELALLFPEGQKKNAPQQQ
jgi:peroxiredoxin